MATRGELARAALVQSAERLFAERGIEAVSLRDVCAAAGQRNHNAAQYHFGDRQGLIAAVYEARMRLVDDRRRAYLLEVIEDGRDGDIAALVGAIVAPLVEIVAETDGWYGRFLGRTRWEQGAWRVMSDLPTSTSFTAAMRKLRAAMGDDVPRAIVRSRIDQFMTLVIGTIAGWEGAPGRGESRLSADALAIELIHTGVAVLTAPSYQLEGATR